MDTPGIGPYQLDNAIKHWENAKRMNESDRLEYMSKYHNAMGVKVMNVSSNEITFKNYRDGNNTLQTRGNIITTTAKDKLEKLGIDLKGSYVVSNMDYYNNLSKELKESFKDLQADNYIDDDEIDLTPPTWWWEIMIRQRLVDLKDFQIKLKKYRQYKNKKKQASKESTRKPVKTTQTKVMTKKVSKTKQVPKKQTKQVPKNIQKNPRVNLEISNKKIKQMGYSSKKAKEIIKSDTRKPKKEK